MGASWNDECLSTNDEGMSAIADKLRLLRLERKLPLEDRCVNCQAPTPDVVNCFVECERPWVRGAGFWNTAFGIIFAPIFLWPILWNALRGKQALGEEVVVETPIRLCDRCSGALSSRPLRHVLLTLLGKSPLYRDLMDEYPDASIGLS